MVLVPTVFVAVLVIVLGAYFGLVVRPENEQQAKLRKRLKTSARAQAARTALVKEIERLSSVDFVESLLRQASHLVSPIQQLIDQAGYRITVATFMLLTICAAAVPAVAVYAFTGHLLIALIAGAVAGLVPYLWLRRARANRLWKFEEQFPEGIDLISRALRAGHTFQAGLKMVGDELEAPVGPEFRLLYDRQSFGMPLSDALRSFADRTPVLDAKFFATAVLTQRDAGGNLAEVLDNLSSVIRERFKVKRQVRVISAHGRITGWILACLPPVLALVFAIINHEHMQLLWTDPMGLKMLYAAIFLQVVGTLIIRKLVNIEY
jgi:tight adherence protein B